MNANTQNDFRRVPDLSEAETGAAEQDRESSGEREAAAVAAGTLEEESKRSEHIRSESLRDHVHRGMLALVWLIFILIAFAILVVTWHHLVPESWCWLSNTQLGVLETFLFSGALVSAAAGYIRVRI